jgi:hypothetical protein
MRRVDRAVEREKLAAAVRAACVRAALDAYEDAGVRGLCEEGRWECAVDAVRRLDLAPFIADAGD